MSEENQEEDATKKCPVCDGTEFTTENAPYALKVAGKIYTAELPATTCLSCSETQFDTDAVEKFDIAVMQTLVKGNPMPRAARFLRETLQISRHDLGVYCGVEEASVAKWERRGSKVPEEAWVYLIGLVPKPAELTDMDTA